MKKSNNLLYDIHETPPKGKWIVLALQHVFAMFGATILVPILVNNLVGEEVLTIPVALFTSGLGTLIYILCTKGKSPVYLGSSFAYIAPMATGFLSAGKGGVYTAIIVVGLLYLLVGVIIKFVGKKWLEKLLPPIVVGPMIMIIGLGLASTAVSQIGIASDSIFNYKNIIVAVVTFLVTAIVALKGTKFTKVIPFLIGITSGYVTSIILGMVNFNVISSASFISIPKFEFPFITYTPNFRALLTIVPVALVTIAEHIGDHTVLGTIVNKDLLKDPGLDRTLAGDGIATSVAGLLGGPANTTYGENTSVVGMTKVASVNVLKLAAIFAILISFLGKITSLFKTIPNAVLGGVSLLMYGFIAVNGLRVIVENQIDFSRTRNVVIVSTMLVLGLGGAIISITISNFNIAFSGMSLAAIIGILLNSLLPNES